MVSIFRKLGLTLGLAFAFIFGSSTFGAPGADFSAPPSGPIVDVGAAPVIVVGTAGESSSYYAASEKLIYTLTGFSVDEVQRGDVPSKIVVRTLGGEVGDTKMVASHAASFSPGVRSRLFLEPVDEESADNAFAVVAGIEGKQDALQGGVAEAATNCQSGFAGDGYCLAGDNRWAPSSMPVTYRVNPNTADLSGEENGVVPGFNTWEADNSSLMDFSYGGTTQLCGFSNDGMVTTFWSSGTCGQNCGNALGCTLKSWSGVNITDFDVQMNDGHSWA